MESKLLMMRFAIHTRVVNLQKKEAEKSASFSSLFLRLHQFRSTEGNFLKDPGLFQKNGTMFRFFLRYSKVLKLFLLKSKKFIQSRII